MVAAAAADPDDTPFFPADFTFDDEVVEHVGVRLKGNSSLWGSADNQMKSFKVHFEEYVDDQAFYHLDRLNLHNGFMDPSLMRERLTYSMANDMGIIAPRSAHAEVWVDGARHGLFTMVQQVDSRFLAERFGEEGGADDGNLFKCHDGCPLAYWGDDPAYYQGSPPAGIPSPPCDAATDECGLTQETNEDDPAMNDFSDVITLVEAVDDALQGDTGPLDEIFDVEHFIRLQALNLALANLDSYFGSAHNFYLYRRPSDGRFQLIPWDVNLSYGTFECPEGCSGEEPPLELDLFLPCFDEAVASTSGDRPKPLTALISQVPEYRERYCEALEIMLDGIYTIESQQAAVAGLHAIIGPARQEEAVLEQPPFGFTYEDYLTALSDTPGVSFGDKAVHSLGHFNQARIASVRAQIDLACAD
jgi:hypothetical protein